MSTGAWIFIGLCSVAGALCGIGGALNKIAEALALIALQVEEAKRKDAGVLFLVALLAWTAPLSACTALQRLIIG